MSTDSDTPPPQNRLKRPALTARERFRQQQRKRGLSAWLPWVAAAAVVLAIGAIYFGARDFDWSVLFDQPLRAGDPAGRHFVVQSPDPAVTLLPFTLPDGNTVFLHREGPSPGRLFWGAEAFAAGEELDYASPLAAEILAALESARRERNWTLEGEPFYDTLRLRRSMVLGTD